MQDCTSPWFRTRWGAPSSLQLPLPWQNEIHVPCQQSVLRWLEQSGTQNRFLPSPVTGTNFWLPLSIAGKKYLQSQGLPSVELQPTILASRGVPYSPVLSQASQISAQHLEHQEDPKVQSTLWYLRSWELLSLPAKFHILGSCRLSKPTCT